MSRTTRWPPDGRINLYRYIARLVQDRHSSGKMKDRARARSAAISQAGRDIGSIPAIENVERRNACRFDLRLFCETYNPDAFYFGWSEDHLKVLARIEEAVLQGALYAFAMARGSGKTSCCRMACLWAASYGHSRYVFIIGANASKAQENLDAVKTFMRFLPTYAADFPEIAFPVVQLAGIANRASGQLSDGEPTMITWNNDRVLGCRHSSPRYPGCDPSDSMSSLKSSSGGRNAPTPQRLSPCCSRYAR